MNRTLVAQQRFGEQTQISFYDTYVQFANLSSEKRIVTVFYADVENFIVKQRTGSCRLMFYGKNIKIFEKGVEKTTTYVSFDFLNDEGTINFRRIFEDRTPLKTPESKFVEKAEIYEEKMNNAKGSLCYLHIKCSKKSKLKIIVDGVRAFDFTKMQYVDGYRIFSIPADVWEIRIRGGSDEDAWNSNTLTMDFRNHPVKKIKIVNHLLSNPTIEEE